MKTTFYRFVGLVLPVIGWLVTANPGAAIETAWIDLDFSQVRLVLATAAVGDAKSIRMGLQIKMKPGFKTYWRSPGDSGIPPRFDWAGSNNFAEARIAWPAPERFVVGGFNTFGYADEVVLPIEIDLAVAGQAFDAHLQLTYGVCRDICVLGDAELVLTIPTGAAIPTPHQDLIEWFSQQVPTTMTGDVDILSAVIIPGDEGPVIEITAEAVDGPNFDQPDILVEGLEEIALPAPVVAVDSDGRRMTVRYPLTNSGPPVNLVGRRVTLTLLDSEYAFEKSIVLSATK